MATLLFLYIKFRGVMIYFASWRSISEINMANAEISILGRDAHAIESPRSTFSLQSYMLILI